MNQATFSYEGTAENFQQLVIENSHKGPVLVNYHSRQAGPCRIQTERLISLARELEGRFLLVNVDVDQHPVLAREAGLKAIPAARIYAGGVLVDSISGAESTSGFQEHLRPFLSRPSDRALAEARALQERGDIGAACQVLANAAMEDPENVRLPIDLAKLLLLDGRADEARKLLTSLPGELRSSPGVETLRVHSELIHAADNAPDLLELEQRISQDPTDLVARFQLAARAVVLDDPERALEHLLAIHLQDPNYEQGIARRSLLVLFDMLGSDHELVTATRARMLG